MDSIVAAPAGLPVLHGRRVRLRAHEPHDLPGFFALYADPEVARYWSHPAWTCIEQARERFAQVCAAMDPERVLAWAIADPTDNALIGGVTLFAIDRRQGRAELGYALHSQHWGRGLGRDAVDAVIAHAFGALGLRRLEADIDPRNAGSCALVERLGFRREGLLRERWHVAGEACDSAMYGLLAREWNGRPSPPAPDAADQSPSSPAGCT